MILELPDRVLVGLAFGLDSFLESFNLILVLFVVLVLPELIVVGCLFRCFPQLNCNNPELPFAVFELLFNLVLLVFDVVDFLSKKGSLLLVVPDELIFFILEADPLIFPLLFFLHCLLPLGSHLSSQLLDLLIEAIRLEVDPGFELGYFRLSNGFLLEHKLIVPFKGGNLLFVVGLLLAMGLSGGFDLPLQSQDLRLELLVEVLEVSESLFL